MTTLALFASAFAVAFLLGLQQLLVHGRRYPLAFINGVLISLAQLALFKIVPHDTGGADLAAFLAGGPFGIITAMWLHDWIRERRYQPSAPITLPDWMQPLEQHERAGLADEKRRNQSCGADRP